MSAYAHRQQSAAVDVESAKQEKYTAVHPLATLKGSEILKTSEIVQAEHPDQRLLFRIIQVQEPPKDETFAFLQKEAAGQTCKPPTRRTLCSYQIKGKPDLYESIVDLDAQKVIHHVNLGDKVHAPASPSDMRAVADIAMASDIVKSEIQRLKLPENTEVFCEPWPYGKDGVDDDKKMFQCWFFLKSAVPGKEHDSLNHYAHPLDFSIVVDDTTHEILRLDRLPMTKELESGSADDQPWEPSPDQEYASDLQESLRQDLKPLIISQPEGVSFQVENDEIITWQKWRFHLDFNWREGAVLRNVTYDGRPTFYRLSLAEMTVPYGDPRAPYHRKSAYDLGEGGAGSTANDLQLGCDCLGSIRYFDRWINDVEGKPVKMKNCLCMHEVDAGIGWKHTSFKGKAEVTRARELVIQLIMTISNYEYCLYWILDTAGAIHYEVKATGIMSVVPMRQNMEHDIKYGIMVAPGVMAPCHQHIFSLRIDPAIDAYDDSQIKYEDTVPMEYLPKSNPYGVAYEVHDSVVDTTGTLDLDVSTNRAVKFVNRSKKNSVTGKPVGYKLHLPATQLALAHATSMHGKRAEFADHHFYFTKYNEREMFPAGDYPWQSSGGKGVKGWAARKEKLDGKPVVFANFGFTHNPRPEDWPVMPVETMRISLKPSHFFTKNPALDMPPSTQKINKSVLVNGEANMNGVNGHTNGHVNGSNGTNGSACCSSD